MDIYSFAIVLWEIYTRKVPYENVKLFNYQLTEKILHEDLRPEINDSDKWDKEFLLLVKSCWCKMPKERPTASEVVEFLHKLRVGEKTDELNLSHVELNFGDDFSFSPTISRNAETAKNKFYHKSSSKPTDDSHFQHLSPLFFSPPIMRESPHRDNLPAHPRRVESSSLTPERKKRNTFDLNLLLI